MANIEAARAALANYNFNEVAQAGQLFWARCQRDIILCVRPLVVWIYGKGCFDTMI
jgi:hypothetical protein